MNQSVLLAPRLVLTRWVHTQTHLRSVCHTGHVHFRVHAQTHLLSVCRTGHVHYRVHRYRLICMTNWSSHSWLPNRQLINNLAQLSVIEFVFPFHLPWDAPVEQGKIHTFVAVTFRIICSVPRYSVSCILSVRFILSARFLFIAG